jgi:hypothetical protein
MTPAQFNLLRATALLSQVPASGVLRDGVREALAVVDAETARGLNAPRDDTAHLLATQANARRVMEDVGRAKEGSAAYLHRRMDAWESAHVALCDRLTALELAVIAAGDAARAQFTDTDAMRHIRQEHRPLLDAPAAQPVDTIVAEVRAEFLTRSERGIAKYGVTLDRTDLGIREWLVHFREELMDGVLYATRAMRELAATAPPEPPHAAGPDLIAICAEARHEALRDVHRVAHMASNGEPDYAGAVRSLLRGATEALQAAAPVLAPLAPEPPAAVLGRAGEALAWDGRQPPVWVEFEPGAKHPYGDDAYQMTTDGKARMFPSREAAQRWLAAMGKAPV